MLRFLSAEPSRLEPLGVPAALDTNPDVRYALAENHNISRVVLTRLSEDPNPYVAYRANKTLRRLSTNDSELTTCGAFLREGAVRTLVATDLAINRGTIVAVLNSIEEEGMGELQVSAEVSEDEQGAFFVEQNLPVSVSQSCGLILCFDKLTMMVFFAAEVGADDRPFLKNSTQFVYAHRFIHVVVHSGSQASLTT